MKDMSLDIVNNTWIKTTPIGRGTAIEHFTRYIFAAKLLKGTILDAGCGTGFGAFFLSHFADKIIGVDYDKEALAIAKKNWSNDNIKYIYKDLNMFDLDGYDNFVMFECLEHLSNPIDVLAKLKKGLNKDGVGIVSIPVNLPDPYHKIVYKSLHEMATVIGSVFDRYDVYYQIMNHVFHYDLTEIIQKTTPSFVIFIGKSS